MLISTLVFCITFLGSQLTTDCDITNWVSHLGTLFGIPSQKGQFFHFFVRQTQRLLLLEIEEICNNMQADVKALQCKPTAHVKFSTKKRESNLGKGMIQNKLDSRPGCVVHNLQNFTKYSSFVVSWFLLPANAGSDYCSAWQTSSVKYWLASHVKVIFYAKEKYATAIFCLCNVLV